MTKSNWDKVATEYRYIKSEEGDLCRKYIIFPEVDRILSFSQGGKALDIGCGSGLFVNKLETYKFDAVGFDFSEKMIANAKDDFPKNIFYVHDLAEDFKEKDESYDLVTSFLVFQDISDETFIHALNESYRVLKKGGSLLSIIPHPNFIREFHNLINAFHASYMTHRKATYIWKNGITIDTDFYLRPLSYYINSFIGAGFIIKSIQEPILPKKYKSAFPGEFDRKKEIPGFLIVNCVK